MAYCHEITIALSRKNISWLSRTLLEDVFRRAHKSPRHLMCSCSRHMLAFNFDMSHRLIEHINITLAGQWVYTADITRILQNLYSDVMTSFIRVFLHIR
jgi:hypothetical protein